MPFDASTTAAGPSQTMQNSYSPFPQGAPLPAGQFLSQAGPSRSAPIDIGSKPSGSSTSAKRHRPQGNGGLSGAHYRLRDGTTNSRRDFYDDEAEEGEEGAEEQDVAARLGSPLVPPRKRMHFDFGNEAVGRFASMSIQHKQQRQQQHHHHHSSQSAAYTVQSPSTSPTLQNQSLRQDSGRDFLSIPNADVVEIPPPAPPCSPRRIAIGQTCAPPLLIGHYGTK